MYKSDLLRKKIFESALKNKPVFSDRVSVEFNDDHGIYTEIIKEEEFKAIFSAKEEYKGMAPLRIAETFVSDRIGAILGSKGYIIDENTDYESSDFYDGYELKVRFKLNETFNEELFFEELDNIIERPNSPSQILAHTNIPKQAKKEKTQNPRKVDLILKSVFESKFLEYHLSTDIGDWKPSKTLKQEGKLNITWENVNESKVNIETLIFPDDSNKIKITVISTGKVMISQFFEIYRIPTDAFLVEKFFRKTFFNLLKKFIETKVIQLYPFESEFIFWKTDNPFFSYSFSSPKKNKIIKDLISFISIARKPILDDFFETNNLKHKQGYLQTLLDSAEAAGIFKFAREGNEIIILRGPNYKAFLDGKIRRVAS